MLTCRKAIHADIPFLFTCCNEAAAAEKAAIIYQDDFFEFKQDHIGILRDKTYSLYILEAINLPVGFFQLREMDYGGKEAEGTLWLGKKRNSVNGLSAYYLLFYFAFETLTFNKLWGWVRENNAPMRRICDKFGLRIIASCKRPAWKANASEHFEKIIYYEITLPEYREKKELIEKYARLKR